MDLKNSLNNMVYTITGWDNWKPKKEATFGEKVWSVVTGKPSVVAVVAVAVIGLSVLQYNRLRETAVKEYFDRKWQGPCTTFGSSFSKEQVLDTGNPRAIELVNSFFNSKDKRCLLARNAFEFIDPSLSDQGYKDVIEKWAIADNAIGPREELLGMDLANSLNGTDLGQRIETAMHHRFHVMHTCMPSPYKEDFTIATMIRTLFTGSSCWL